jgi:TonB family protein
MSFGQASNSLSLLRQQHPRVAAKVSPSTAGPQFEVRWNSFHQSLGSSIRALVTGPSPRKVVSGDFLADCWVEGRIPRAAVIAAALWHIVFLLAPWPELPATPRKNPAFDNFQLTWSGPINDFPPLKLTAAPAPTPATPSPRGDAATPIAREGAEAFHPRQRIFTDPIAPTHPRQTLINTAARIVPPKILPSLPNIVLLQQSAKPAKPRMELTEQMLAQLHPRENHRATVKAAPLPDVPAVDGAPAEITLAPTPNTPVRPKLEWDAGAAPRLAQQRASSNEAGPAPELAHQNSMNPNASTLIALSTTPGPVAPSAPPQGNLAARVSISPEGKQPGVLRGKPLPGENSNAGVCGTAENLGGSASGNIAGTNSTTVSISGGNPTPKNMSGLSANPQPKMDTSAPHKLVSKIDPRTRIADAPERTGPPNFAALAPGAKPEQIFATKKMYTMLVNMPNLNSATGSWVLNFSELRSSSSAPHVMSADLSGPSPIKKSDPRYPPTLINEHVEGEVVLYAVIRADGSVDSVELVRGLDAQLDANAMEALSQWKFRPASRQGTPVELEAIVHIPFRAPSEN